VLTRSAVIQEYLWVAQHAGFDAAPFVHRAGLAEALHVGEDSFVPLAAFSQLLESTAEDAPCPDLGLRMAQAPNAYFEGPLIVLLQAAPTLREAFELARGYHHVFTTGLSPVLHQNRSDSAWTDIVLFAPGASVQPSAQLTEYLVAGLVRLLRLMTAGQGIAFEALLPHVPCAPPDSCERHLGCGAQFGQAVAGVRLPSVALDVPLPSGNALKCRMAIDYIESRFAGPGDLFSREVERLLRTQLGAAPVTQESIAAQLAMHVKTMQRRLRSEGTSFAELLDRSRRQRFLELVGRPGRLRLGEVAHLLGYSEQAALTRSCQRWFQRSPSEMMRR
jgi:AraC-like DNA-binding protein